MSINRAYVLAVAIMLVIVGKALVLVLRMLQGGAP